MPAGREYGGASAGMRQKRGPFVKQMGISNPLRTIKKGHRNDPFGKYISYYHPYRLAYVLQNVLHVVF